MRRDTRLVHGGRHPEKQYGLVNPPVYRGSTVLFPDLDAIRAEEAKGKDAFSYGRHGTPTHRALAEAMTELEGAYDTLILPSGMAAVSAVLFGLLSAGDHLLMTDSCYGPTRSFCDKHLARLGVSVDYYDPGIGGAIADLIRPETRLIFTESPGSLTFEVQDIPAIVAAARDTGVLTAIDNTWATPLFFRPLDHGVDVSIQAATKYIVGHADALLGTVATRAKEPFDAIRSGIRGLGYSTGPDDVYLGLRGLRTLSLRLSRHQAAALQLAQWLQQRPEVARVLYPALPGDPGHDLWLRDFGGATGLMGAVLQPDRLAEAEALCAACRLFGIGFSWGGFESLIYCYGERLARSATAPEPGGPLIRLHVGLEDPQDLIADLDQAFTRAFG